MLRAQRTVGRQTTTEDWLYISSLRADGARFAEGTRSQLSIENSLHQVLAAPFLEDESRKREDKAPGNFPAVGQIAVNLLKGDKALKRGVAGKRLRPSCDEGCLEGVLSGRSSTVRDL